MLLEKTIAGIGELNAEAMEEARGHQKNLIKPYGSLGMLEDVAVKIAGITGEVKPVLENKAVITCAGDHGVAARKVSVADQEVTRQMVRGFLDGGAAINVLTRHAGARVICVDVGMVKPVDDPRLKVRRVGPGTGDIATGPAMSREQARAAVEAGIEVAAAEIEKGVELLATGDMGIGNTTPSTAILAAFTGFPAFLITGRGTGIDREALQRKAQIVEEALKVNKPDPRDGLDVLAGVGGFEIGAIAGVILSAAASRVPVVIDGFISGAGAMIARALAPRALDFVLASHLSEEPGHKVMLTWLGVRPLLQMNMRLGEGTGAALSFTLIDAALKIVREMATYDQAGVSDTGLR
ncbi:MAG: nicotinate-nucleotide--dimethylbenzimidazole phosphoribosyltransferase [Dethiobacteria bacterium]|jgi:nicotinate-nucleotide--dimethylbenzimidazole phosphoribosyltransferase|nr:nicotinate-nucleotide--dimethylbenzimidazole phosphoribosyltransferase [Bacillota bacterium]NMD32541.1 nicotinate-nucleotide--dimethylbenzimidazole phosphoribosyltransferase [Bacillota bacterium]HOB28757.1 nicotinate-nucleotide--dimethylbenzimidazole phosphoribosyltransferase [Bacillota bacterium]HPZ41709.1 nicotinate-nucleotide--dimethylbenzimidazole phosphoribosyltransferase [Bacillota bacterium]HQD52566.1 nicotinate-nucleotide--dimethylbenzimidazole phosphoribosyltransferase [Bacillota ba